MGFIEEHKTLALATVAATGGALAFWITISSQRRQQKSSPATTDFDSFLTKPIANPALNHQQNDSTKNRTYAATSFEAYLTTTDLSLKNSQLSGETTATAADSDSVSIPCCPPNAKPVTILYGTEFGFSREIAEKLCQRIKNLKTSQYWPELINLADYPEGISGLENCQIILIVCSTQGDGVPPTEVRDFCRWLGSTNATTATIGPINYFSVLALGDRSYTHFARCGKTIDARLQELGATRFTPRVDVNKEDLVAVDGWIDAVLSNLDSLKLSTAEEIGWNGVRSFTSKDTTTITNGIVKSPYTTNKWTKSKPYFASIINIESLCNLPLSSDSTTVPTNGTITDITTKNTTTTTTKKNTVHVVIDLGDSGIEYFPGDSLGIWPTNDPRDVDDVLDAAGISKEMEGNVVVKVPAWHYKDEEMELNISGSGGGSGSVISLREALSRCYDLRCPKPEILQLLASKLDAIKQKETNGNAPLVSSSLNKSLNASSFMGNGEKYLAERHVADILRDWKPATVTVDELLSVLHQLQPRLYSISSSPLEVSLRKEEIGKVPIPKGGVSQQGTPRTVAELTVAVVKYTSTVSGKSRVGVASTYLAERSSSLSSSTLHPDGSGGISASSEVPVYVYQNPYFRLPSDLKTPIIMVGPGTGVAPFRAFIQHRILLAKAVAGKEEGNGENNTATILGPALLFFGCRRRDEDYLYGTELEKWASEGYIQLFTAFSRETEKKIYVQHRLLENGKVVWQILEAGAVFYVCGDGAHMAGDVESALKSIIEGQGQKSAAAAVDYFENMVKTGRYKKDVWVS
jgi:sulfite reductase (NADPH) flavoprotein alpha-component